MPQTKPAMPKKSDCKTFIETIEHDYKVQFKKYLSKPEFINCVLESHSLKSVKFKNLTPLFWAIVHKKNEAIIELLERGADSNAKVTQICMGREETTTPFIFTFYRLAESVDASQIELYFSMICNMLEKGANKACHVSGMPLLHFIYYQKNKFTPQQFKKLLGLIVDNNAKDLLNIKDAKGKTLLHLSIFNYDPDFVKLLLDLGANPNATSTQGAVEFSPLRVAAERGLIEIVTMLLDDYLADINQLSGPGGGASALHIAANLGNIKLLRLLLDRGANIDLQGNNDVTALYIATQYGHYDVVEELLRRGANLYEVSNRPSPLKLAIALENQDQKFSKIVELLKKYLPEKSDLSLPSVSSVSSNIVEWFMSNYERDKNTLSPLESLMKLLNFLKSYNVNEVNSWGNTLLSIAVELRSKEMVKFLLKNGAKVYVGNCPVVLAASHGLTEIVSLLLTANIKEETTCIDVLRSGCTALHLAVQNNHIKTVEILLGAGFSPELMTSGSNSLHIALKKRHYEIAEILIKSGKVDVNLAEDGCSPLQMALFQSGETHSKSDRIYELICLLIKFGANLNEKNILLNSSTDYLPNQNVLPVVIAIESTPEIFNLLCQKTDYDLLTAEDCTENPLFILSIFSKIELVQQYFNNILKEDSLRLLAIVLPSAHLINSEMLNYFINKQTELLAIEQFPVSSQTPVETSASCYEEIFTTTSDDPVAMRGRAYLKRIFKMEDSQIDRLISDNKDKGKHIPKSVHRSHFFSQAMSFANDENRILSFAQGGFSISLGNLEKVHGKENCWHYISEDLVSDQGCPEDQVEHFRSVQKFVSNGDSRGIKFLDRAFPNELSIEINNIQLTSTLSYELKIKKSPARILGFSLLADDGKTTVYFACLYLSKGLHELSDIKALAGRGKTIKFKLPEPVLASSSSPSLS